MQNHSGCLDCDEEKDGLYVYIRFCIYLQQYLHIFKASFRFAPPVNIDEKLIRYRQLNFFFIFAPAFSGAAVETFDFIFSAQFHASVLY